MFDGVRHRVRDFRTKQDDLALEKAQATIQYAVSLLDIVFQPDLTPNRMPFKCSAKLMRN